MTPPTPARPFPARPAGWYYAADARRLGRGPVGFDAGRGRRVAFLAAAGTPAVLDARCSHMAADLSRGTVDGGCLRCPLHGWAYAADGRCTGVPAGGPVPPFAHQAACPTAAVGPHLFFYDGPGNAPAVAPYPMPFFDGVAPADLRPARPFEFTADTPWYLIAANGFDLQHFAVAHDRTLAGPPTVDAPSPFARRITATFDVTGDSWPDRLTRRLAGPSVRMAITVWSGTLVLVTATFRRTTSYGLVAVTPLADGRSHVRVIVWVPRRHPAASLIDRLDARVRRRFIRSFVMDDAVRSDGIRYHPATLTDADRELAAYLRWLAELHSNAPPGVTPA